jgi:hypothetical protein
MAKNYFNQVKAKIDALKRDQDYTKYIENLRAIGYFGTELEGSEKWSFQEEKAADMFVNARRAE